MFIVYIDYWWAEDVGLFTGHRNEIIYFYFQQISQYAMCKADRGKNTRFTDWVEEVKIALTR